MNDIRYYVTDNDGVNIDSEDVAMRVMDNIGVGLVRQFSPASKIEIDYIYRTFPGTSTDKIIDALVQEFDLPVADIRTHFGMAGDADVSEVLADFVTLQTNNKFKSDLKSIDGVTESLEKISQMLGLKNMALATTSRADRMNISLECAVNPRTENSARLGEFFPEGERRRSGYGHANKYTEAFNALGWDPAKSVVIEDSLSGVTKAKAHSDKIRVVGTVAARFFQDKYGQAEALINAGASLVITNMDDLPRSVSWLSDGMRPDIYPDFTSRIYLP